MRRHLPPFLWSVLCRLAYWLPVGAALALALVAGLGNFIGLDADSRWGEVRVTAFAAGIAVLVLAATDRLLGIADRLLQRRGGLSPAPQAAVIERPAARRVVRPTLVRQGVLGLFFILVLSICLGLATVWIWPRWPNSTYLYDSLAQSFARGRLDLAIQPSPALATLDNPYDPAARKGIDVVGDLSYYRGRYYMYWSPTPAILSAIWLVIGGPPVSDALIVYLSISVMFLFSASIVLHIKREYFPGLPNWLVFAGLVLVTVTHPTLWTLNSPSIYTAAISSGQAFFIGGVYFMLTALKAPHSAPWREVACGTMWALAIGCRLTLLVAIAPLLLAAVVLKQRPPSEARAPGRRFPRAFRLLAPIALGLALLAAYNFARFGDPLETGFRYQMVGDDQGLAIQRGLIFNPRYVVPTALFYLAAPIRLISDFPFVRPWYAEYPPFAAFLAQFDIPRSFSVQNAAGLIFVTPALLLGALLIIKALTCPAMAGQQLLDQHGRILWPAHAASGHLAPARPRDDPGGDRLPLQSRGSTILDGGHPALRLDCGHRRLLALPIELRPACAPSGGDPPGHFDHRPVSRHRVPVGPERGRIEIR